MASKLETIVAKIKEAQEDVQALPLSPARGEIERDLSRACYWLLLLDEARKGRRDE